MITLVLAILLCPLRLVSTNGVVPKSVTSAKDNSAKSVSRLYSLNPVGLYGSASPYGAYSFYAPTYVPGPQTSSSKIVPVKEENVIVHNSNGYLKDSYGNRFMESPQSVAYKTVLPQQFIQLQDLPAHLSQPLSATAHSYNLKQHFPQYYYASPHVTSLQTIPSVTHFMRNPQSIVYGTNIKSLTPSATHNTQNHNVQSYGNGKYYQRPQSPVPTSAAPQQQSSSYKAVYANSQNVVHKLEPKHQRLQENPHTNHSPKSFSRIKNKEPVRKDPTVQSITTKVNGKKTVININTKPPLPLLDISLLEPLTFANPVVPQIQHFLPRIPSATYHKLPAFDVEANKHNDEFVVTNTRSYDSGIVPESSDEDSAENDEKSPPTLVDEINSQNDEGKEEHSPSEDNYKPENNNHSAKSPNYKEINNENIISYSKTTQNEPINYSYSKNTPQEPVHYSYTKQTEQKPIHYSNVYSSNKPIKNKEINYDNVDRTPKQHVYEFKNNKSLTRNNGPRNVQSFSESESAESENSAESEEEKTIQPTVQTYYNEQPRHFVNTKHLRPEHRQEIRQNPNIHKEQFPPIQYLKLEPIRPPIRIQVQHLSPPEYEQNIQFWPLMKSHAAVKVNPNQAPAPSPQPNIHTYPHPHDGKNKKPKPHFHGTAKRVIIKDESPDEKHLHQEQMMKEETNHEENSEEDFENSYKNAAYGFPAFDKNSEEDENAFDPESYGVPRYYSQYNIENSPFQQYQTPDDDYPKSMRASYKDSNDKNKENYYLDYSINKPESLVDEYQNKIDYYKMLRNHKKDDYFPNDQNRKEKSSKYNAAPYYGYESDNQQPKKHEEYRSAAPQYEYDYSKEAPRDNSANPTHANIRTQSKTQFVEPQFQYGFEPLSLPILLDSEPSAVASNNSPKNENPDVKKKIYKENFYIKKTNIYSGKPAS